MALLKTVPSTAEVAPKPEPAPNIIPDISEHLDRIENSRKEMEGLILALQAVSKPESEIKKQPSSKFLRLMEILKNVR